MKTRMLVLSLIAIVAICGFLLFKRLKEPKVVQNQNPTPAEISKVPDYSGIQVKDVFTKDLRAGKGAVIGEASTATVSYEGWIYDPASLGNKGKLVFPKEKYKSVSINMKGDGVLMGFKKGLLGMKKGGLRQLIVPENLAYGDKGFENLVPPKAILLFEIELSNVD